MRNNQSDDLKERYQSQVDMLSSNLRTLKGKGRLFITLELIGFCFALLMFVLYCINDFRWPYLLAAVVGLAVYLGVRRMDILNDKAMRNMAKRRIVYSHELSYLRRDYTVFDDGARYIDPRHAYTYDMDVFGRNSLFNRICRTVTTGGSDALASMLSTLSASADEVRAKREAIDELARDEVWRTEFLARGQRLTRDGKEDRAKISSENIMEAIRQVNVMRIPSFFSGTAALVTVILVIVGFFLTVILSIFTSLPAAVPVMWAVLQLFIVLSIAARPLRTMMQKLGTLHDQMQGYISLIRHINAAEFSSLELRSIRATLFSNGSDALSSFNQLSDILARLDRRANILGLVVFNILFLSDFLLVRRFVRWQTMYVNRMGEWVSAVSRIDAFASMAVLKYNHEEAVGAELTEADGIVLEAEELCHPFLGAAAVSNDFTVLDGNFYIITGANMAGKSTFLRSVGVNYILALCGMPVFADRMRVSVFNLFSSMRTSDDLSHGISYFNAELLRLRQLIDSCRHSRHTLIILDEILKGTNSLDKLNGSRLFLEEIAKMPVSGIIATHDLELSRMEEEHPSRFHNYCFEIQLGADITYSYKITLGVARNQNATYLLKRMMGIEERS